MQSFNLLIKDKFLLYSSMKSNLKARKINARGVLMKRDWSSSPMYSLKEQFSMVGKILRRCFSSQAI